MILKDFLPSPYLKEFVRCYRIVHFEFDKFAEPAMKAYPPKPEECLMFQLKGHEAVQLIGDAKKDELPSIVLIGQQTSLFNRYPAKSLLNFIIVFQPSALHRLIGISSFELANKCLNAADIFAPAIKTAFEKLQNASSYNQMLSDADEFMTGLVEHASKTEHALDALSRYMLHADSNQSVDWLAKQTNLCVKRLKESLMKG